MFVLIILSREYLDLTIDRLVILIVVS